MTRDDTKTMISTMHSRLPSTPVVTVNNLHTPVRQAMLIQAPGARNYLLPSPPQVPMVPSVPFMTTTKTYDFQAPDPDILHDFGKIYRPVDVSQVRGLVILAYGQLPMPAQWPEDTYLTVWEYLGRCLASNRFVCVSIRIRDDSGIKNVPETADIITRHLHHLYTNFGVSMNFKGKPLALVGQSQAGAAANLVATRIHAGDLSSHVASVRSVVSLAGTPNSNLDEASHFEESYLCIQGTHDGDFAGGPPRSIQSYEQSIDCPFRCFMWIHGANHVHFLQRDVNKESDIFVTWNKEDLTTALLRKSQKLVTQNLVTGFLLWKMAAIQTYKGVFIGEKVINFQSPDSEVQIDFTKRLKVFPRFDSANSISIMNPTSNVAFTGFSQGQIVNKPISKANPAKFDLFTNLHRTMVEQKTSGIVVNWDRTKVANPLITVLCPAAVFSKKPVSVEFHAVLTGLTGLNPAGSPVVVFVSFLLEFLGTSNSVPVEIAHSSNMKSTGKDGAVNVTSSQLSTIRLPMSLFDFKGKSIVALILSFSQAPNTGEIAIGGFRANLE